MHPLEELVDELLRTTGRLTSATTELVVDLGLTAAQHTVLTAVVRSATPPTVPQIARSLGHSRQAVQRIADDLVTAGLLDSEDNPGHKRARLLVATERGTSLYRTSEERAQSWAARVTHGIEQERIDEAAATLRRLRHALEA
ncbi:MAG: MarR family transcriptional regulator [Frankiales bacterium]|nr:MarR family transcriptional regulator [Frankiales bacterium]